MYALLPAMRGVTDALLLKAMQGLMEHYQDNQPLLAHQFVWMQVILDRATIIPELEKQKVRKELNMYDNLWNEDPTIQRIKAEAEAKGEAKARSEMLESMKDMALTLIEIRFPDLLAPARKAVANITSPADLKRFNGLVGKAPDENIARFILNRYTEEGSID